MFLWKNGLKIIAVEQVENSKSLNNFSPVDSEKYSIVFGNEIYGVNQDIINEADEVLEIPQLGTKHSLNISVSVGIVIWHFFNCLKLH